MISLYDLKKSINTAKQEGHDLWLKLSDDEKDILDSKTDERICSTETYLQYLREKMHCDFEVIYSEHVSLTIVYRCKQCGTVIFGGDDEERFNPNEKCPTCCNDPSVTFNKYWTKEEIDVDPEKQKMIQFFIDEQARMNREYKRRQKRGGLYDWQRSQKEFSTNKHGYRITRINHGFDGDTGKTIRPADTYLEIVIWNKETGIREKTTQIPLNFYAIWIRWIYPYSRRCHPDVRKYAFWQKKPKKFQKFAVGETVYVNFDFEPNPVKMKIVFAEGEFNKTKYIAESSDKKHSYGFPNDKIWKTVFTTKKLAERYRTA